MQLQSQATRNKQDRVPEKWGPSLKSNSSRLAVAPEGIDSGFKVKIDWDLQHLPTPNKTIVTEVNGLLKAGEQVYFKAGARFKGVLQTPKLVIEEGASLVEAEVVGQEEEQEQQEAEQGSKVR